MSGFSSSSFKSKLEKLSESQQSIQTLSHWVQYHKKAVKESAAIWAKEVLRAKPDRRLLYVYLANDIMQNSRRKGNEFVEAFGAQMPLVMPDTYVACPDRTREKLLRLLSIWEERRVLRGSLWSAPFSASLGGATASQPGLPGWDLQARAAPAVVSDFAASHLHPAGRATSWPSCAAA